MALLKRGGDNVFIAQLPSGHIVLRIPFGLDAACFVEIRRPSRALAEAGNRAWGTVRLP